MPTVPDPFLLTNAVPGICWINLKIFRTGASIRSVSVGTGVQAVMTSYTLIDVWNINKITKNAVKQYTALEVTPVIALQQHCNQGSFLSATIPASNMPPCPSYHFTGASHFTRNFCKLSDIFQYSTSLSQWIKKIINPICCEIFLTGLVLTPSSQ